ncbi:MAG: SIS domain-containing protein [Paracoccaceae bacterium]
MTQYQAALAELGQVFDRLNDARVDMVVERLAAARRIVVFGAGRERLQVMGLAMRLFHMGLEASVAGDMTAPPVGRGDVFLAVCGPGWLSTAEAMMRVAKDAGAEVIVITAQPGGRVVPLADLVLHLPAQTMADDPGAGDQAAAKPSTLPMGSLFEGALFVLCEVMVLRLMSRLGISAEAMRARHTNLE